MYPHRSDYVSFLFALFFAIAAVDLLVTGGFDPRSFTMYSVGFVVISVLSVFVRQRTGDVHRVLEPTPPSPLPTARLDDDPVLPVIETVDEIWPSPIDPDDLDTEFQNTFGEDGERMIVPPPPLPLQKYPADSAIVLPPLEEEE